MPGDQTTHITVSYKYGGSKTTCTYAISEATLHAAQTRTSDTPQTVNGKRAIMSDPSAPDISETDIINVLAKWAENLETRGFQVSAEVDESISKIPLLTIKAGGIESRAISCLLFDAHRIGVVGRVGDYLYRCTYLICGFTVGDYSRPETWIVDSGKESQVQKGETFPTVLENFLSMPALTVPKTAKTRTPDTPKP